MVFSGLPVCGCSNRVTSLMAEQVTLYKDEAAIPAHCECPGEVTASACTNKSSCPAEVMKKKLREKVYTAYGADAVWLFNTTLSGTELSVMEWRAHAVNKCS